MEHWRIKLTLIVLCFAIVTFLYKFTNRKNDPFKKQLNDLDRTIHEIHYDIYYENVVTNLISKNDVNRNIDESQHIRFMVQDAAQEAAPIVLLNAGVSNWSALSWDLWELALSHKWPILRGVLSVQNDISNQQQTFVVEKERDVGGMIGGLILRENAPVMIPEMFFADFLHDLRNSSPIAKRYFYSTDYQAMENIAKLNDATSWRDLIVAEGIVERLNYTLGQVAPLLNILYPGCALQARYSEYHTMRTQIKGRGRYTLFAPHHAKDLYLFPNIHFSHQQSQVDFSDTKTQMERFPRFKRAKFIQTTLEPGEVMYVPPFWTVHSEAPAHLSVTLDVLSVSHEQLVLAQAYSLPLPFPRSQSREERIVSAQVFLVHVLSRIKDLQSIRKFSSMLYSSRYALLYPPQSLFVQHSSFHCFKDDLQLHRRIIDSMDKDAVVRGADHVAKIVNDGAIPSAIRWLWLGNYVEQIARWAMGDPEQTVLFVRECLDMEGKIEVVVEVEGPSVMKMNPEL